MYTIEYSKQATRTLRLLPLNTANLIRAKLVDLAQDPLATNNNVKKLSGQVGYRLRVGDWRVLYVLDQGKLIVYVSAIGARGGVYK